METFIFKQEDNKEAVEDFACCCKKCGYGLVTLSYDFTFYSELTGWDHSLSLSCRQCGNSFDFELE